MKNVWTLGMALGLLFASSARAADWLPWEIIQGGQGPDQPTVEVSFRFEDYEWQPGKHTVHIQLRSTYSRPVTIVLDVSTLYAGQVGHWSVRETLQPGQTKYDPNSNTHTGKITGAEVKIFEIEGEPTKRGSTDTRRPLPPGVSENEFPGKPKSEREAKEREEKKRKEQEARDRAAKQEEERKQAYAAARARRQEENERRVSQLRSQQERQREQYQIQFEARQQQNERRKEQVMSELHRDLGQIESNRDVAVDAIGQIGDIIVGQMQRNQQERESARAEKEEREARQELRDEARALREEQESFERGLREAEARETARQEREEERAEEAERQRVAEVERRARLEAISETMLTDVPPSPPTALGQMKPVEKSGQPALGFKGPGAFSAAPPPPGAYKPVTETGGFIWKQPAGNCIPTGSPCQPTNPEACCLRACASQGKTYDSVYLCQ